MRKVVTLSKAIQGTLLVLAILAALAIFPVRAIHTKAVRTADGTIDAASEAVDDDHDLLQQFVAQYDRMDSVELYVTEFSAGRYIAVQLFDQNWTPVFEEYVDVQDSIDKGEIPGYVRIPLKVDLTVGDPYTLMFLGKQSSFKVAYESAAAEHPGFGALNYHDSPVEGERLAARYVYRLPLGKGKSLISMAALLLAALLIGFGVRKFFSTRPDQDPLVTVGNVVFAVAMPIGELLVLAGMIMVFPMKLFDDRPADILMLELGLILTGVLWFYGLRRLADQETLPDCTPLEALIAFLQMLVIAIGMQNSVNYMNDLFDIHHRIHERAMMICLILFLLLTFKLRELFRIPNLVWVIASAILGMKLYYPQAMAGIEKEADLHAMISKENIAVVVLGVWFFLTAVENIVLYVRNRKHAGGHVEEKRAAKIRISVLGVCTALLFILMIVMRNTRLWGVALVCISTVLYVRVAFWTKREQYLQRIAGGLLLHFVGTVVYCLLHRYFVAFVMARFPMTFHTVTVTAQYLTIMEMAALVLLLASLRRIPAGTAAREICRAVFAPALLFGLVTAYLIFTMSRTGYIAAAFACLMLLLLTGTGRKRGGIKAFGRNVLVLIISVVVLFPAAYSLQRIVPAVVEEPYTFLIEDNVVGLRGGANWDNRSFMSVERFFNVLGERILMLDHKPYDYDEDRYNYDENGNEIYGRDGYLVLGYLVIPEEIRNPEPEADAALTEEGGEAVEETAEEVPEEEAGADGMSDVTNGRMDIFRSYLSQMTMNGHDEMGAVLPNGEIAVHAHNVFLQFAYDHGIPAGILFALWVLVAFIAGYCYDRKSGRDLSLRALPMAVVIGFVMSGLAEWNFQFSNPMTYALMLSLAPLMTIRKKA